MEWGCLGCWHPPTILFDGDENLLCYTISLENFLSLNWRCRKLSIYVRIHFPRSPLHWGFWCESMGGVTNTLLPNVHSTCSGGKISCCRYKDFITYSSPRASDFVVELGKSSCHSSSKINMACGKWLSSPIRLPHNGLSFHIMNMPLHTNNSQCYGLSSCNSDK